MVVFALQAHQNILFIRALFIVTLVTCVLYNFINKYSYQHHMIFESRTGFQKSYDVGN